MTKQKGALIAHIHSFTLFKSICLKFNSKKTTQITWTQDLKDIPPKKIYKWPRST